ncbi:MAG: bifunctional hydroxymethylpyrimidine kinase/phosphomethylpyrimidine kinase [Oscillospiraceae bacterium]|nr:bifunctional hydroxymethylpyrimidine kinase/phosphomethylpyrimidine kinase [Oscillospiraceae bacterium]
MGTVLSIAGSDPIGGAGIQADIKAVTMQGCYAMTAITALTVQNTRGVTDVMNVPADFIAAQIDAVFTDVFPDAVKIGMVSNTAAIHAIAERLRFYKPKAVVVDPVMVSTSGHALLQPDAAEALCTELIPLASVITPNLSETAVLLGREVHSVEEMRTAARELSGRFGTAVLVKGGHLSGTAADVLFDGGVFTQFETERIDTPNTHGTGCTLSSAIASGLAKGLPLAESVRRAKQYLTDALKTGFAIGHGNGPLLHNFALHPCGVSPHPICFEDSGTRGVPPLAACFEDCDAPF